MSRQLIPRLRFPGFSDEWEMEKFEGLADKVSESFNPLNATREYRVIELESLSQGTGQLLRTFPSTQQKSIKNKFQKGDVLYGKLRPYLRKFYHADFAGVCTSEIWVFRPRKLAGDFLYLLVQSKTFNEAVDLQAGSKMPRADWRTVASTLFAIPQTHIEQKKVAAFFKVIDTWIAVKGKHIELLKQYRSGVVQQILAQQVRFKNQNKTAYPDWEQKKLGQLLQKNKLRNKDLRINYVQSVSNKHGFVSQDDYFDGAKIASKNTSNYFVIEKGTFAYNPSRINVGSLAYKSDDTAAIVSPLYVSFRAKQPLLDSFLLLWFTSEAFASQMHRSFEGSVRDTLSFEALAEMRINLPDKAEQAKIAAFITCLDTKIDIEETKLNHAKQFKKSLLQRMFV